MVGVGAERGLQAGAGVPGQPQDRPHGIQPSHGARAWDTPIRSLVPSAGLRLADLGSPAARRKGPEPAGSPSLGPNPAPWLPAAAFPIAGLSRKDSTCVPQLIQQGKWGWRRGHPDAAGAKAMQGLLPQLRRESFPSAPEAALPEDWLQTDPSHWGPAPSAAGTGPSLPASPAPTRDAPSQRAPKGRGVLALRSGRSDGRRAADPPPEPQLALGAGGLRGGQWGCQGEAKPRDQILPRAAGVSSSILRPSL